MDRGLPDVDGRRAMRLERRAWDTEKEARMVSVYEEVFLGERKEWREWFLAE